MMHKHGWELKISKDLQTQVTTGKIGKKILQPTATM